MCVICTAARKRHMTRKEVLEAIKANSAGFFGFTVHDGVRKTIRTLDDKEFMAFFDAVGDDEVWAMHARIPSRGEKTLDNVHGWEEDGIIFCHNMTLTNLDEMMDNAKWEGTDSEFFFRHVFIPFYRGCGPGAYKDGKFCPDLDNIVRHFCGQGNKFLFIMPDNRFVRYGHWVEEAGRREGGEVAFHASNSSYKVYKPAWPPAKSARAKYLGPGYYLDEQDDYDRYAGYYGTTTWKPAAKDDDRRLTTPEALTKLLLETAGPRRVCEIALCHLVAKCVSQYKSIGSDKAADALEHMTPDVFTGDAYEAVVTGLSGLVDEAEPSFTPYDFAQLYAGEAAEEVVRSGIRCITGRWSSPVFASPADVEAGLKFFDDQWEAFCLVAGLAVDFTARSPTAFACVADQPTRNGGKWKIARARPEDVLVDETMSAEDSFKAVDILLAYIQAEQDETAAEAAPEAGQAEAGAEDAPEALGAGEGA